MAPKTLKNIKIQKKLKFKKNSKKVKKKVIFFLIQNSFGLFVSGSTGLASEDDFKKGCNLSINETRRLLRYATLRYATLRYATLRYATLRDFMEKFDQKKFD
jgi:hypothetical protein